MWPFKRKTQPIPTVANKEDALELIDAFRSKPYLPDLMESEIKKQIISGYEFTPIDESGYFNRDFNIQPTITRLKTVYTQEPWVYACVQVIVRAIMNVNFVVKDKETNKINTEHPLNKIINASNSFNSINSIQWAGLSDLIISGNYVRVFDKTYSSSIHVPIEYVNIVQNQQGLPVSFEIINPNTQLKETFDLQYVLHIKLANPFTPLWGMSPFTALARPILLDRYKNEFETAFYLRGCAKAGVIETDAEYSLTRMSRLMATFEQVFTGKRNWWRPLFLPKGAKWIANASTLSEMQHLEGLRENRLTILGVMGIPPSQVGIVQDVNRSTAETQQFVFYENTIKPYARFIADAWNNFYVVKNMFNSRVYVDCDYSNIPALQESLKVKGDYAEALKNFFTINEIRKQVFNADPLTDGRGDLLVSELQKGKQDILNNLLIDQQSSLQENNNNINITESQNLVSSLASIKQAIINDQEQVEQSLGSKFKKVIDNYIDAFLNLIEYALKNKIDPKVYLQEKQNDLKTAYEREAIPILIKAMERAFTFSTERLKININKQSKSVSTVDRQAIDYLREETRPSVRLTFAERAINRFVGFNRTRSNEVLDIIAALLAEGQTTDQIASIIRQLYHERYKEQAFTITRTEILTAISHGIKWNQDILKEVFTAVKKQWLHVGDEDINPQARQHHAEFEELGEQDVDFIYPSGLSYPRDPNGPPGETINCRCTLVNIIPEHAQSNAESILLV